jgi:hypothetical protein
VGFEKFKEEYMENLGVIGEYITVTNEELLKMYMARFTFEKQEMKERNNKW